ncbi:MAG: acyl carrier protein [Cyanobacteria bacterium P01_A01_bin.123]
MNRLQLQSPQQVSPLANNHRASLPSQTPDDIQKWLVAYLAELLEVTNDDIDSHATFDSYGLDSVVVFGMAGDLENWLGHKLEPTLPYTYPTIAALAQYCGNAREMEEEEIVL